MAEILPVLDELKMTIGKSDYTIKTENGEMSYVTVKKRKKAKVNNLSDEVKEIILLKNGRKRFVNTCTFDAVFHVLASCYADNAKFSAFFKERKQNMACEQWKKSFELIECLVDGDIRGKRNILRDEVLKGIYGESSTGDDVDCTSSPTAIADKLLCKTLPTCTMHFSCKCGNLYNNMGQIALHNRGNKDIDLQVFGIQAIAKLFPLTPFFNFEDHDASCEKCQSVQLIEYKMSPMLFLNVQHAKSGKIAINDIPKVIRLRNKLKYKLKAIIELEIPKEKFDPHSVAYCLRGGKWQVFDDLRRMVHVLQNHSEVELIPQCLVKTSKQS